MNKIILGIFGVFILFVVIVVIAAVSTYNGLVNRSQAVDAQWAQVQNVYQRRADLIPNLVNTVAGAANFEKSTLTEITEARASVGKVQLSPKHGPDRSGATRPVRAGSGPALVRAFPVAGGRRALSGFESHRQFPDAAVPARRHGESNLGGTRPVQRCGPRLQFRNQAIPGGFFRRSARIQGQGVFPGCSRSREAAASAV